MCTWNPKEKVLASGSADGVCRLWGVTNMDPGKWAEVDAAVDIRSSLLIIQCIH